VHPAVIVLVQKLVEGKVIPYKLEQFLVLLSASSRDVGRITPHVLAVFRTTHGGIEFGTTVARIDGYRLPVHLPQRV
jgi:hypothetical protein